jgi:hypothetical protein
MNIWFGGKPEGKRPLGTPRRRWKYNIKIDLQEVECERELELSGTMNKWRALAKAITNVCVS